MGKVRRSVGAFVLATVVATGMVLTPASAQASDLDSFCSLVAQAISFLDSKPSSPLRDALLARLKAIQSAYCGS